MDGTSPVSADLAIHSPVPSSSHLIDPSASSRWKEILDSTSFFHANFDRKGAGNFSIHLQFHKVSQPKVPHQHTGHSKNLSCVLISVLIFVRTHFSLLTLQPNLTLSPFCYKSLGYSATFWKVPNPIFSLQGCFRVSLKATSWMSDPTV